VNERELRDRIRHDAPDHRPGFWEDLERGLADDRDADLQIRAGAADGGRDERLDGGRDTRLDGEDTRGVGPGGHRTVWLAAAAAAVTVAIAGGLTLALTGHHGGGATAPPRPTGTADVTPTVRDIQTLDPADVAALVRDRHLSVTGIAAGGRLVPGTVEEARTWRDRNGENLLVVLTTVESTMTGGRPLYVTVHVGHVANLDGPRPRVLSVITDPLFRGAAGGCRIVNGRLEDGYPRFSVEDATVGVTDLDGDGQAEATVAWDSTCATDVRPFSVMQVLTTDGRTYVLRGQGYPEPPFAAAKARGALAGLPEASFTAEPAANDWPAGYLTHMHDLFFRQFGLHPPP